MNTHLLLREAAKVFGLLLRALANRMTFGLQLGLEKIIHVL